MFTSILPPVAVGDQVGYILLAGGVALPAVAVAVSPRLRHLAVELVRRTPVKQIALTLVHDAAGRALT